MVTQNDVGHSAVYRKVEKLLRGWLTETGGQRVDTYYNAIHLTGEVEHWLSMGGQQESVRLPSEISFAMDDLRPAQADPRRGAWLWSHFWMEAAEGALHQEADWMREPVISARPIGGADAVVELERYPRDPEWIPEWMAAKMAAYREEEARERQEAGTEAAQAEGNGADERDSGRVGRSDIE